jgi:hypothetical protein
VWLPKGALAEAWGIGQSSNLACYPQISFVTLLGLPWRLSLWLVKYLTPAANTSCDIISVQGGKFATLGMGSIVGELIC